jgi:hypothetical protein
MQDFTKCSCWDSTLDKLIQPASLPLLRKGQHKKSKKPARRGWASATWVSVADVTVMEHAISRTLTLLDIAA